MHLTGFNFPPSCGLRGGRVAFWGIVIALIGSAVVGCGGGKDNSDQGTRALNSDARVKALSTVPVEGADTAAVWSNPGLTGQKEIFSPGVHIYALTHPDADVFAVQGNDDISSLRLGTNAVAWLCANAPFLDATGSASIGPCQVYTVGVTTSLVTEGFDDQTSSIIVTAGKAPIGAAVGLVAWSDNNYSGATQSFGVGGYDYADIANGVGNDSISSLEVKSGYVAVLCSNGIQHAQTRVPPDNYPTGAECRYFPAGHYPSMPNGLNDVISYISVVPAAARSKAVMGEFGPVKDFPLAAINQYLLTDGRVMLNEQSADDGNASTPEYVIWDPVDDSVTMSSTFAAGTNLFCSAFVHLPNGDLFATATGGGGNTTDLTMRYDSATGRWELAPKMIWKRYYPTASLTPSGGVLVTGGNDVFGSAYGVVNAAITRPEIFEQWVWRELPGAEIPFSDLRGITNDSAFFPWVQAAPNGRMFMAGPDTGMRYIDTAGSGGLTELGSRDAAVRTYGSYAMYAPGKLLVAGGAQSLSSAAIVSFDGVAASVAPVAPMKSGRRQFTLTILANGEVFAVGGNRDGAETYSEPGTVYDSEIWNPVTETWRWGARHTISRQYHSTAMLIPDGRVVVAGQCAGPPCQRNAEIYSPPYLFNADGSPAVRPSIGSVKDQWRYGETISATHTANSLTAAHLIKLGAVTHATNFEQRLVPLPITSNSGGVAQVTAPANPNLAPPGHYMMFLVGANGVPTVAKIVQISNNIAPLGTATESSNWNGIFPASNSIDGSTNSFSHTATEDAAASWTLQWTRDYTIEQVVLHNRKDCCNQRLRDIEITVYDAAGNAVYTSGLLNPGNSMSTPKRLELDFYRLGVVPVTGRKLMIRRIPDPTLAGGPGDNADGANTLSLSEVQVFAKP